MSDLDMPYTKTIIKRVVVLLIIIILLALSVFCADYYKSRVAWKNLFDLSYLGSSDIGYEYELENKTNSSYSASTVYIKISDAHRDYIIPYDTVITLHPHGTKSFVITYKKLGEYFGKEEYHATLYIAGFEYEKK